MYVKVEARSTFTFTRDLSVIHFLYFLYGCKIYVRSHGKVVRQWKSTLTHHFTNDKETRPS